MQAIFGNTKIISRETINDFFLLSLSAFSVQPSRVKISLLDSHHYHTSHGVHDKPTAMSAGRAYQIQCAAEGAKPNKPTITWWIGTKQVRQT